MNSWRDETQGSGDQLKTIDPTLFPEGRLSLGCNYWASHAGTAMWRNWQPEGVRDDLETLARHGVKWLRVFPLWPDFQPIMLLRGQFGKPQEFRHGEIPLADDPLGRSGLSAVMLERFQVFCKIAEQCGLKLVVGLITGWMSGRLFVPQALEGFNPISDPRSIAWQVRFVKEFVNFMKGETAIVAWDLGNECNCMGEAASSEDTYVWTATIANAIRVSDPHRPLISGMHSLSTRLRGHDNKWLIEDQAELTDILTTHPYPYWVRHADLGHVNDFRTTFHATAESCLYRDIGGKPCIAEEIGTMGPMISRDDTTAQFARLSMWSLWANDCRAFSWWCAHDQTELVEAPYDWNGIEVELGLLRSDKSPKPVLEEFQRFHDVMSRIPNGTLPPPHAEACCILTHDQDDWAAAYGAFILAKQAKLEIRFSTIEAAIPKAQLYLLPSLTGPSCVPKRKWLELLDEVREGATLYVSFGNGIVPHFSEAFGAEIVSRARATRSMTMILKGDTQAPLAMLGAEDIRLELTSGEGLGWCEDTRAPIFWRNQFGLGTIYGLAFPLEVELSRNAGSLRDPQVETYWKLYASIAAAIQTNRLVYVDDPAIAVTEHPCDAKTRLVVLINHGRTDRVVTAPKREGWRFESVYGEIVGNGERVEIKIPAMDAAIMQARVTE
ncbi:glycoside hydrolase 5 family protein [Pararhizobium antarcticum]|uniref:Glycoside hydrolase family 5 domain-containing protein n=1 Tax=Pararhizobium antarcticum TaxID=1798805 RepID=A0A657LMA0_9HYPH|nr:cellulase family glycosylhydrolase [Pararhizobium antarcticum]OJF90251.1 hypothetical protein AX760_24355 [Pararhizobium antarcticum]